MAARIMRSIAGLLIIMLGIFFLAGGSVTRESNLLMVWVGGIVLCAVILGGIASAAYDVTDGLKHKTLRAGSLMTLCALIAFAIMAALATKIVTLGHG